MNILYSYFGQKELVKKQLKEWQKYKDKAALVYVDDCSPEPLEKIKGTKQYRILTDIKWNQGGARNLGMSQLKGWVIMLDMDYILTKKNLEDILKLKLKKDTIYYLGREREDISYTVYIIHTDAFKITGGYDEDFSGHYGYEDALFNLRCKERLNRVALDKIKLKNLSKPDNKDRNCERNKDMLSWKMTFPENGKQLRFKWIKL